MVGTVTLTNEQRTKLIRVQGWRNYKNNSSLNRAEIVEQLLDEELERIEAERQVGK